jgi:hypothetical protein
MRHRVIRKDLRSIGVQLDASNMASMLGVSDVAYDNLFRLPVPIPSSLGSFEFLMRFSSNVVPLLFLAGFRMNA